MSLVMAIFFVVSAVVPCGAAPSEARGTALATRLLVRGKSLPPPGRNDYQGILKEKRFDPSTIPALRDEGFSVYATESDFMAQGDTEGAWKKLHPPMACQVNDGALACRRIIKAPRKPGVYCYSWTFRAPGGGTAVIIWEYRVLTSHYARLLSRSNGGPSRGVYGGEPVQVLDLTSGISPCLMVQDMDDSITEEHFTGTWTVEACSGAVTEEAALFDMRMLAVRDCTVNPPAYNPSKKNSDGIIFKASIKALPEKSRLFSTSWLPDSIIWRLIAVKTHKEGGFLVHRAWGGPLSTSSCREQCITVEHRWTGSADGSAGAPRPGLYRILIQARARCGAQWIKSQMKGGGMTILPSPRIAVSNENGEIIADSEELRPCAPPALRNVEAPAAMPAVITFVPSGHGFIDIPPPSGALHIDRIYQKHMARDELFTISVEGQQGEPQAAHVSLYSNLPGRKEQKLTIPFRNALEGASRTFPAVSRTCPGREVIFIGKEPSGEKSFAVMDLTDPEDTDTLKILLGARGWNSHGDYVLARSSEMSLLPGGLDFLKAGGYETLTISCQELPDVKAILHIRNQADLLYYGGHGWGNGFIALNKGYAYPEVDIVEGDWSDNLKVVIFSSCSMLDIQNYNGRKFTALGRVRNSPGIAWAQVAGPDTALLGYNWTTKEGKPPDAFDTRVLRRFLALWSAHSLPIAWIYANIREGDSIAPCALYRNRYYFIHGATSRILSVPKEAWNMDGLPSDARVIPWPR